MTTIALWLLLGTPTPSPMPTLAPVRAEALANESGSGPPPAGRPFLRSGVRVVAGPAQGAPPPAPKSPPLP